MSLATLKGHAMALALSVLKRTSDGWEGIGEVVTTRVTNSEAEPGQILPHQREPSKRAPGPSSFCTWRRPHWGFTPWANPQPIFQLAQTAASATLSEQPLHTQLRSLNWATSSLWSSMVQRPLALLCYSFLGDTLEPRAQKLSFLSWVFFAGLNILCPNTLRNNKTAKNGTANKNTFSALTRAYGCIVPLQPVEFCAGRLG